jgi:hypothetical protein
VDWDEDGLIDLIVGDSFGYINFFRRLPGGDLTRMPLIEFNGEPLLVERLSAPVVTDWNEDGLHDLLIGSAAPGMGYGTLLLYLNQGSAGSPLFEGDPGYVCVGEYPLVESYTKPGFIDVTGDGLRDIVYANGSACFFYMENTGIPGAPSFEAVDSLTTEGRLINLSYYGSICMADWDADGYPDLLAGDFTGRLFLYRATGTGVEGGSVPPGGSLRVLPNPARDRVSVSYAPDAPVFVEISLYTIDGRLVEVLYSGVAAGSGVAVLAGDNLEPGVYFVTALTDSGRLETKRVILLR